MKRTARVRPSPQKDTLLLTGGFGCHVIALSTPLIFRYHMDAVRNVQDREYRKYLGLSSILLQFCLIQSDRS